VKLKPQVTILVSADDAQRITQALEKGRVLATLRSDLDLAHRDSEGTTTSMTLGHREEQRAIRFDQSYGAPVLQPLEVIAGAERRTEWH
jgi:Flp pilus assembly protein CpaB